MLGRKKKVHQSYQRERHGIHKKVLLFCSDLITFITAPHWRFCFWSGSGPAAPAGIGIGICIREPSFPAMCETYSAATDEKKYESDKCQPKAWCCVCRNI